MLKRGGTWHIGLLLSAALDRCAEILRGGWCFGGRIVSPNRRQYQSEVGRSKDTTCPSPMHPWRQGIELKEFINIMRIGDRIRVFCDDGVLVAEKISHTQFKLIDCQRVSGLIH